MDDLIKLQYQLTQDHVESALEMSKRGGHLWIFLAIPLLARKCRIYIYDLAQRLGVPVKGSGLAEGIEVFPKHDEIQEGAFGNALRGPLGIHRGANRRFWFYGADYTLEAQIEFLTRLRKLTEEELDRFTAGKELPPSIAKVDSKRTVLTGMRSREAAGDSAFSTTCPRPESWERTMWLGAHRVRRRGATAAATTWRFLSLIRASISAGRAVRKK